MSNNFLLLRSKVLELNFAKDALCAVMRMNKRNQLKPNFWVYNHLIGGGYAGKESREYHLGARRI